MVAVLVARALLTTSADHRLKKKREKKIGRIFFLIAVGLRPGSPKPKISPFHTTPRRTAREIFGNGAGRIAMSDERR